jgi:ABC-2 type transport system ATP-binding protein
VAQGTKRELLAGVGSVVTSDDDTRLGTALAQTGLTATTVDGALHVDAEPVDVGRVALQAGVALTGLRPADGAGLEEMFLELTSGSDRDDLDGAA